MRKLLMLALVAAPLAALAPSASAYCDPDYRPACLNDCHIPNLRDPLEYIGRGCPR